MFFDNFWLALKFMFILFFGVGLILVPIYLAFKFSGWWLLLLSITIPLSYAVFESLD